MLVYLVYFVFIAIIAVQYEFTPFQSDALLLTVTVLLILLAGFRDISVGKDYANYQNIFDNIYFFTSSDITGGVIPVLIAFEPGFLGIIFFMRSIITLNYGVAIMLSYALSSMLLKVYAIRRLSINPYLTLLFYYAHFYMLHEMTQIRIGLASAIFLVALISFLNGKKSTFAALILLATLFHYSAIFYLLVLFFDIKTFNRNFYAGALAGSIVLGLLKLPVLNLIGDFDASDVSGKLSNYIEISQSGEIAVNVFNSLNILNILCCLYLMFFVKQSTLTGDKRLLIFLKCNILSVFLLSLLAGAPAFAMRFSDLFSIVQIFLFTYLVRFLPARKFNVVLVVLLAGLFLYVTEFYGELLSAYKIIQFK